MVKVKVDLSGQKFGKLTVLRQAEDHITKRGIHTAAWLCQCDCGSDPKVITGSDLKKGSTISCGCYRKYSGKVKVGKDLTGKKFGRWEVIEQVEDYIEPRGKNIDQWLCRCECGTYKKVLGYALKRGSSQSCGCLRREQKVEQLKKYNTYDLSGEYGIGYTTKGEAYWFDLEDYEKIKDKCWYYGTGGYLKTSTENGQLFFHREIMGVSNEDWNEVIVDHRQHGKMNEPKFDNRKSNLRIVDRNRNNQNVHIRKDNASGVTGVTWDKRIGKWRATIQANKIFYDLGCYDDLETAKRKRKEAEEKYFGEYSFDNSQKDIKGDEINERVACNDV